MHRLSSCALLLVAARGSGVGAAARFRTDRSVDAAPGHRAGAEARSGRGDGPAQSARRRGAHRAGAGRICCPTSAARASITRQTAQPGRVRHPHRDRRHRSVHHLAACSSGRPRRCSTPAPSARLRAARDTAVAVGLDAQAVGEMAGATAGLAYLRVLSARGDGAGPPGRQHHRRRSAGSGAAAGAGRREPRHRRDPERGELRRRCAPSSRWPATRADRARLDLVRALDLPSGTRLTLADSLGLGRFWTCQPDPTRPRLRPGASGRARRGAGSHRRRRGAP